MAKEKILLAQLNSNGDCLYATVLARQIKEADHPGCHLTWAVNSSSKQSILLNPFVDEIWEVPTETSLASDKEWNDFVAEAEKRKLQGDFDQVYYTQIIGKNLVNLDGSVRSSIYNNYPHPITVSQQPIIRLSEEEVERVRHFISEQQLKKYEHVILVECGPDSFRSSLNPKAAYRFAKAIASAHPAVAFILSSNKAIQSDTPQVMDASILSFRENAELTKCATLFIGCSSGISWLATTDWARPLPMIILTNPAYYLNTSMLEDHQQAGLPTGQILEITEGPDVMPILKNCIEAILSGSFVEARSIYHQPYKRKNFKFLSRVSKKCFELRLYGLPFQAYRKAIKRYGFNLNAVLQIIKAYIKLPYFMLRNALGPKH